jgi:predicted O-methyltransferase YrrM
VKSAIKAFARPILNRLPYIGGLRKIAHGLGSYPPGHFYSPIPARDEVLACLQSGNHALPEIVLNKEMQFERLRAFQAYYADLPFPKVQTEGSRYHYDQTVFCHADAIFLYSFLRHTRPRHIIEAGSGFSSAVMLDTVDRFFEESPQLTFIEPYPSVLRRLLRPQDGSKVTVIEEKVQNMPVQTFSALDPGDLLFIDSSHVVKCGSDVQYLMFEVLPRLQPGVFVHFHDVFHSFEYPENWLLKGWYWNEAYFLRAFLAYNSEWEIYFFNSYVGKVFKDFLKEKMPLCLKNTGGSLYLRRIEGSECVAHH